eukprot:jgi/Bigna1/75887/fgenesh1_pg.37_\
MSEGKDEESFDLAKRFMQCSEYLLNSLQHTQKLYAINTERKKKRSASSTFAIQQATWCNAVCIHRASELIALKGRTHEAITPATATPTRKKKKEGKTDFIDSFAQTANLLMRTGTLCEEEGSVRLQCTGLMRAHLRKLIRTQDYPPRYLMEHFARGIRRPRYERKTSTILVTRNKNNNVGFRVDKVTLEIVSVSKSFADSPARAGQKITHVDGVRVSVWSEYERYAKPKKRFQLTVKEKIYIQPDVKAASVAARQTKALITLLQELILDWHENLCGELKHHFHKLTLRYLLREADRRITPALIGLHRNVYRSVVNALLLDYSQ